MHRIPYTCMYILWQVCNVHMTYLSTVYNYKNASKYHTYTHACTLTHTLHTVYVNRLLENNTNNNNSANTTEVWSLDSLSLTRWQAVYFSANADYSLSSPKRRASFSFSEREANIGHNRIIFWQVISLSFKFKFLLAWREISLPKHGQFKVIAYNKKNEFAVLNWFDKITVIN